MSEENKNLIVVFEVGSLTVSVPALDIHEILVQPEWITLVPEAPPAVMGVFGHRSEVFAAVSVRREFGFPDAPKSTPGELMLSRFKRDLAAFWVDRVVDVIAETRVEWLELPVNFENEIFDKAFQYNDTVALHTNAETLLRLAKARVLALSPGLIQAAEAEKEKQRLALEADALRAQETLDQESTEVDPEQDLSGSDASDGGRDLGQVVRDLAQVRLERLAENQAEMDDEAGPPVGEERKGKSAFGKQGTFREIRRVPTVPDIVRVAAYSAAQKFTGKITRAFRPAVEGKGKDTGFVAPPRTDSPAPPRTGSAAPPRTGFVPPQAPRNVGRGHSQVSFFEQTTPHSVGNQGRIQSGFSLGWIAAILILVAVGFSGWLGVFSPRGTSGDRIASDRGAIATVAPSQVQRPSSSPRPNRNQNVAGGRPAPGQLAPVLAPATSQPQAELPAVDAPPPPPPPPPAPPPIVAVVNPAPPTVAASIPRADVRPANTTDIVHLVRPGDTLWDLAALYLGNPFLYPLLAQWSDIRNPHRIEPGETVRVRR